MNNNETIVRNGIDRIADGSVSLDAGRCALLTAAHARTRDGRSSRVVLQEHTELQWLFSPEHGLYGVAGAGEEVASSQDPLTGLPVFSLYSKNPAEQRIPEEITEAIDAVIYDLPDVGARFYTYVASCLQMVEYCAAEGKKLIILDRVNPLGSAVEGMCLKEEDYSFVGPYSLPNRYGLTIGELVSLYVTEQAIDLEFEIVRCRGWERSMLFPETGQVYTIPSPGLPNWEAALLYPGTCLFEGMNLSEGRGTPRPFSWIGAPYIDQEQLAEVLQEVLDPNRYGLALRPQGYVPASSKYQGEHCQGIAIEILDPRRVRPVAFVMELVDQLRQLYPDDFEFLGSDKGVAKAIAPIERLMGHEILDEDWNLEFYRARAREDEVRFRERAEKILLYP